MCIVRCVRGLRGARRRLCRGGSCAACAGGNDPMTAISPRVPLARFARSNPLTRLGVRLAARRNALPRTPAYLVVCATVAVLNIVGLVMILSASSVRALSDYGSAWDFFQRGVVLLPGAGALGDDRLGRVRHRGARRLSALETVRARLARHHARAARRRP